MKEITEEKPSITNKHRMRAKLIFNPGSGTTGDSPVQLLDVIREMQSLEARSGSFPDRTGLRFAGSRQASPGAGFSHVRGLRR